MSGGRLLRTRLCLACCLLWCACTPVNQLASSTTPAQRDAAPKCSADFSPGQSAPDAQAKLRRPMLAAMTAAAPPELVVLDLATRNVAWRMPLPASTRPEVLDDVVVAVADGAVRAFDLASGSPRFSFAMPAGQWLGSAQIGKLVVFTTSSATLDPRTRESLVTAVDIESGKLAWQRTFRELISRPVIASGRVFAISDRRDLRALDAADGGDLGCISLGRSEVTQWLESEAGVLYYGGERAHALGGTAASQGAAARTFNLPPVDAPAGFGPRASDYESVPAARSAHGRVGWHVALEPGASGGVVASADRMHFVFYRHVISFQGDGSVAWARMTPHDIVRAHATSDALTAVLVDGAVLSFDAATGDERASGSLGTPIASADISIRTTPALTTATTATAPAAQAPALRQALTDMAMDPDTRLLPTRKLASDALAKLADPEATRDLIDIASASATPDSLRTRIAARLTTRTLGLEHLREALGRHYDYLEDQKAPPLALIVPALVANEQTNALPLLVDKLFDPNTTLAELTMCVAAIDALGGDQGRAPLARFLALYHADSAFQNDPSALVSAARALARENDQHRQALAGLREPRTHPALAREVQAWLSLPAPKPYATPATTAAVPTAKVSESSEPVRFANAQQAFATHIDDVRACVQGELAQNPKLNEVRLSFVIHADGHVSDTRIVPSSKSLDACFIPKLHSYRFATRNKSAIESYVIAVAGLDHAEPTVATVSKPARDFWALSESRSAQPALIPTVEPWWKNQNPLFISIEPSLASSSGQSAQDAPPLTPRAQPAAAPAQDAWWLPAK